MLFVMLVSIILFFFIRVDNPALRVLLRILLIPVIAGISYEIIRLAGKSDNIIVRMISAPGMWLQRLTTKEPDESMVEVAIASVEAVFDWKAYLKETFGYEIALKSVLLQALFLLLQYSTTESATISASSDKLKNLLDYIDLHYAEPLTISELAELCYFSEYHFMRFFKKHMNMTCIQYINNVRLEKAVELFEHGETSILEVSLSVGFHNLSYFHRAFKAKYHMTPLSFIKRLN